MHLRRFNLHKTNAANEELVISLIYGREVYSLGNKMDNSLLVVRDINHKYIVVEKENMLQLLERVEAENLHLLN